MNNWKIINKIAIVFGIIFVVFTVLAGVFNYELVRYCMSQPLLRAYLHIHYLIAMLPFLAAAVLSFTVYALSLHAAKSENRNTRKRNTTNGNTTRTRRRFHRAQPKPFYLFYPS